MISFVGFTRWHLNKQLIKFFIDVLTGVFLALSLKKVLCVVFHSLLSNKRNDKSNLSQPSSPS